MDSYGNLFKVSIFGESHGQSIGCLVDGVPAGTRLHMDLITTDLARRAPGRGVWATSRKEVDVPVILSGVVDGKTTGAPIACIFHNDNIRSADYADIPLRPGQADWTALLKYGGHDDRRGGGRFSGRLTAGLVFAGAIAKQLLAERGIDIYGRVQSVDGETDDIDLTLETTDGYGRIREYLRKIAEKPFPAANENEQAFLKKIITAKYTDDSVGGVVEAVCFGLPPGVGEPFFGSVESRIASMLFSVPAIKGVEFGSGFLFAYMHGIAANDPILPTGIKDNYVSKTNHNGGVLGGISNGMPIIVRAAIKPTASIALPQDTVDPKTGEATTLVLEGRHDPCIAPRAVPVVEAGMAISLVDLMLEGGLF